MSELPTKNIVTEGDAKVNTINALGDLSHVASRISSKTKHLLAFVMDMVDYRT